jgi:hypothetical protein
MALTCCVRGVLTSATMVTTVPTASYVKQLPYAVDLLVGAGAAFVALAAATFLPARPSTAD